MSRMSDIIATCKTIEHQLRKYQLWANLVPRSSWFVSLYRLLPRREWDIIRRASYAHYGHKCAICGMSDTTLYGHEDWEYDYDHSTQRLVGVLALCHLCHMCNHLGLANIQAGEGKLDYSELVAHWCQVNSADKEEFTSHSDYAFKLWELRNEFEWQLVGPSKEPISQDTTADDVLGGLWKQ